MSDAARLARGLAALGIDLPDAAHERLLAFAALLLKWNRVYNLTAIRDPAQVVTHHLLDSLAVLPYLADRATLVDVGSGGGLPGIPLAIARSGLAVESVEAVSKKASFQQQAKIELGLVNFQPHHCRVERFAPPAGRAAVISRAFSDLGDFLRLTAHLGAPGARWLAMKGVYPHEEIATMPGGFVLERAVELRVPDLDAARHLIIMKRDGDA